MFWSAFSVRKRRPKQRMWNQAQRTTPDLTVATNKLFFLQRTLPVWLMDLCHTAQQEAVIGNVTSNRGTRSDSDIIAHGNRRNQLGIRTDKHVIADNRFVLVYAVVVAGNGTGADIHVVANICIAKVRQVARF